MKARQYINMMGMAAAVLLSSCVKDTLYDTPHPDYGKIAVTADWSVRGEGIDIPATWTVTMGGYTGTETSATHTPDHLFAPGSYTLAVWKYQTAFQQPFQVLVDHFRGITGARLRSQQIFQTVFGHGLAGASVPHGNALHRPPLIRLVTGKKPRARPQFPHYLFRSHHGTIGASVKGSFILGQNSRTCYQGKGNTQKNGTNHER